MSCEGSVVIGERRKRSDDMTNHHGGSLVPMSDPCATGDRSVLGTRLPPRCSISLEMTRSVRTFVIILCPPDTNGHDPDTQRTCEIVIFGQKTRGGRPADIAGHWFNHINDNDLTMFFVFWVPPYVRTCKKSSKPTSRDVPLRVSLGRRDWVAMRSAGGATLATFHRGSRRVRTQAVQRNRQSSVWRV